MSETDDEQQTRTCPYCFEKIPKQAVKCKSCGEWVNADYRAMMQSNPPNYAIYSIIPGLGQIMKGQPFNGALWFVMVLGFYILFWPIGLVLHALCIAGASMKR